MKIKYVSFWYRDINKKGVVKTFLHHASVSTEVGICHIWCVGPLAGTFTILY